MAYSQVGICNMALGTLGSRANLINLITDASREAQLCNLHWDSCRDSLLEEGGSAWSFAHKIATPTGTTAQDPWGYGFSYPTDCVWPIAVLDPDNVQLVTSPIAWERRGRVILTNQTPIALLYVQSGVAVDLWSGGFVMAMAAKLAWILSNSLAGSAEVTAGLFKTYQYQLQMARAAGMNSGGHPFFIPFPSQLVAER